MENTVKVTFDIDRTVFEQFKGIAKGEGRSMTWYVNGAIRGIVEKRMGEPRESIVPAAVPVQKTCGHRVKRKS